MRIAGNRVFLSQALGFPSAASPAAGYVYFRVTGDVAFVVCKERKISIVFEYISMQYQEVHSMRTSAKARGILKEIRKQVEGKTQEFKCNLNEKKERKNSKRLLTL